MPLWKRRCVRQTHLTTAAVAPALEARVPEQALDGQAQPARRRVRAGGRAEKQLYALFVAIAAHKS